jgi:hypothetical protein
VPQRHPHLIEPDPEHTAALTNVPADLPLRHLRAVLVHCV